MSTDVVGASVQGQPVVYVSAFVVIVLLAFARPWVESLVTIAHEGGHVVLAILAGRRVLHFYIDESNTNTQSSGATEWTKARHGHIGVGDILTWLAGYLTPPLVGLASANLVLAGKAWSVLMAAVVLLVGALVKARDPFTIVVVALAMIGVGAAIFLGSPALQAAVAVALAWLWLIGGVTTMQGQGWGTPGSDAGRLAEATWIPAFLWVVLFGFVAIVCLWVGARRLLGI